MDSASFSTQLLNSTETDLFSSKSFTGILVKKQKKKTSKEMLREREKHLYPTAGRGFQSLEAPREL